MSSVPKASRGGLSSSAKWLIYCVSDPASGRAGGTEVPIPFHGHLNKQNQCAFAEVAAIFPVPAVAMGQPRWEQVERRFHQYPVDCYSAGCYLVPML
jgi:hypothetical protein